MQLNLTTGYAIRMVVYLAKNAGRSVPSHEISEATCISQKYLIRIASKLRLAHIVESAAGVNGGFSLMRPASEITLYEVAALMEETIKIHRCLEFDHFCSQMEALACPTYRCFLLMQRLWEGFLTSTTIADLLEGVADADLLERILAKVTPALDSNDDEGGGDGSDGIWIPCFRDGSASSRAASDDTKDPANSSDLFDVR